MRSECRLVAGSRYPQGVPELPISDSDRRERPLPEALAREPVDPRTPCGDCGREYRRSRLQWIYGGWVCINCVLGDDGYK